MEGKTCPHKKCRFSHESKPVSKPASPPPMIPSQVAAPTPIPPLQPYKPSQLCTDTATTPFMPVIPTVQTIYVPESQYMMALEMAMKSGKNIRIEIAK